jgi:hypothetical protein
MCIARRTLTRIHRIGSLDFEEFIDILHHVEKTAGRIKVEGGMLAG